MVVQDHDPEYSETFTLTLNNAANAALPDASATGTIIDNDMGIAVSDGRAAETAGEIVFTVT